MLTFTKNKTRGFSLIELIVFIIILAISVGIVIRISYPLAYVHRIDNMTQALELAQQRMEIIIQARNTQGFASFSDPCAVGSPPAICSAPAGFTLSSSITSNWGGSNNYREITVTVSGAGDAYLNALVSNYE